MAELTDRRLEVFHEICAELIEWHEKHEPHAFQTIASLKTVHDEMPYNVSELMED